MGENHNQECSKEESLLRDLIKCNGLPQFRVDHYGEVIGQQPINATTEFSMENGELYVQGFDAAGYSVIDGDLVYSFVGNVENDPTKIRSCCK